MQAFKWVSRVAALAVRPFAVALVLTAALLNDAVMGSLAELFAKSDPELTLAATTTEVTVDSQLMRVSAVDKDYAFSMPGPDIYRFEVLKNDFGWSGDAKADNRRSELVSEGDRYFSGETLWSSFSFVVGPEHIPFDDGGNDHNTITQWHSVDTDVGRSPVFAIQLNAGDLVVTTRSDKKDSGRRSQVHYSEPRPTDGKVHNVVVSGLLGKEGHLDMWLDGTQIVNADTPIGYYNDDDGERALAYPHWGIYQDNVDDPAVLYHSNMEWGLTELSPRVQRPLEVVEPPGGWV